MSGIFHRRKPSTSGVSELDLIDQNLHNQTTENQVLKGNIDDLKIALSNNKAIFEQFLKENEESEHEIQKFKQENQALADKIKDQDSKLKELKELKFQLVTEKDYRNPSLNNNLREIQGLLDLAENEYEILIFKDANEKTWEIIKRNDINAEDLEI